MQQSALALEFTPVKCKEKAEGWVSEGTLLVLATPTASVPFLANGHHVRESASLFLFAETNQVVLAWYFA